MVAGAIADATGIPLEAPKAEQAADLRGVLQIKELQSCMAGRSKGARGGSWLTVRQPVGMPCADFSTRGRIAWLTIP
jgi:hypothetical protein